MLEEPALTTRMGSRIVTSLLTGTRLMRCAVCRRFPAGNRDALPDEAESRASA
jgi:hypothetical protein